MAVATLLIDGDMLLYSAAVACEYAAEWDDNFWTLCGNLSEAKALVEQRVQQLEMRFGFEGEPIIALSDPKDNFRKALDPTYKAGRGRKPLIYWQLREWLVEAYTTLERPTLEADDVMGILATSPKTKRPVVIVSDDKDMLTIPATLWRADELIHTDEATADRMWLMQTLTGDTTDGYPGCPGIGIVGAAKLLKDKGATFDTVVTAFEKKGYTADDALLQARLARILRHSDWDAKRRCVKLWQPEHTSGGKHATVGELTTA